MTVNLRLVTFATVAVSWFVGNSRAAEFVPFTVTFTWPSTDVAGSGTLILSNNILRYHIVLPGVVPWRLYILRPPERPRPYFFDSCPDPGTNSLCILEGDLSLTEMEVSELFQGRLTLGAHFLIPLPPHAILDIKGRPVLADTDQDGVPDYLDECPETPLASVVSDSGCSIEQLCPCNGAWKNHGQYLKRLLTVTGEFLDDSLITEAERSALLLEAAKSDCGKR